MNAFSSRFRRLVAAVAIFLATVTVVIAAIVFLAPPSPPPSDADLALVRIEPRPEDNAFPLFAEAAAALVWPTNADAIARYVRGDSTADDEAIVEELIALNAGMYELIQRGAERPRCVAPEVTRLDENVAHLGAWKKMAMVIEARTRQARLKGRAVEAVDSCVTLLRFGDLISREPECMLHHFVAHNALDMGLAQARGLARDPATPPTELGRLAHVLEGIGTPVSGLVRAVKAEYRIATNIVDLVKRGSPDLWASGECGAERPAFPFGSRFAGIFLLNAKVTKGYFAMAARSAISNASRPWAEVQPLEMEQVIGGPPSLGRLLLRPNPVGRALFAVMSLSETRILQHRCRADCDLAATRLIVALQRYRRVRSHYPERLDALVPDFLPAVPTDPFDGAPIRYVPERRLVYSVGVDLVDGGGQAVRRDTNLGPRVFRFDAEDVVYEIETTVPDE